MSTLAGQMFLRPGAALPTIRSTRPEAAPRLARGRLAHELPALLGALFTLCGMAHRFTAAQAVRAALGEAVAAPASDLVALRHATAREQALRIVHDWPRQGGIDAPGAELSREAMVTLRACPLWRPDRTPEDQLADLPGWLQHKWLGLAPADWLARHHAEPGDWAARWAAQAAAHHGTVGHWLHGVATRAQALRTAHRPLTLLRDAPTTMPLLARRMATDGFCREPDWQLTVPDTGPWTRQHATASVPADNAWMRLVSRVVDLLQLAEPAGAHWLAQGAMPLGDGQGIAWTEMARGLLVHWVRLVDSPEGPRVADCRVLAPTEWNFHPRGVLAQALAGLRQADARERVDDARLLALAFDPCVEFTIEPAVPVDPAAVPSSAAREIAHA